MSKKSGEALKAWRILWKYLSAYQREIATLSILGILSALANGSVPYIAGRFFDAILISHTVFIASYAIPLWVLVFIIWAVVQVVAITTDWINDQQNETLGGYIYTDYFSKAYRTLLSLPISFYKDHRQGEVIDSITRGGEGVNSITSRIVINLIPKFLSIFIGFVFAFFMNTKLALVLVAGVISYVFIIARIVPQGVSIQRSVHKKFGEAFGKGSQAISNIATVKQFTAELFEEKSIRDSFVSASLLDRLLERIYTKVSFSQRVIIAGTQLIIFAYSVYLIHSGFMTIGELLALNGYAMIIFGPFVTLGIWWQDLQNGLIAIERAEKILSEKPEDYSPAGTTKSFVFNGAIKFKNVSFGYKKRYNVLDGVSFETKPGEMVALVGESGAGKSTLIDLISGYHFPTKGDVVIDGYSTRKIDLKFLRKNIAIVSQEVVLFHDTIKTNIAYGISRAKDADIKKAATIAHASKFIEGFPKKYNTIVGERGIKLSVGQKQRIAIARAILRNPKILILDEPTSALDSETEKYVTEALDRVMEGRTTFIIAHRLSTVRKADKILVLEGGKIIESGNHDELMQIKGGSYRRRYELHVGLV